MIWHIFRKDCNALARGIYAVALLNAISSALWIALGPLAVGTPLYRNAMAVSFLALTCMLLLIAAAVLQDTPSVSEQDWRVRPIKRRDLIAAKLVFAILAVHGPLLVLDFVAGVAQGFGVLASVGAAVARGTALFLSFTLLAMIIATVARDLSAWIRAVVIVALVLLVLSVGVAQFLPSQPNYAGTGLAWIPNFATIILIVIAASVILPLQYHSRRTGTTLIIAASAVVLSLVSALIPWDVAFSIQRAFAAASLPDDAATFSFNPSAGRSYAQFSSFGITRAEIPLRVAGIPPNAMLLIENSALRIRDAQGSIVYAGNNGCVRFDRFSGSECSAANFRVRVKRTPGEASFHYPIRLPNGVYEQVGSKFVRLELDYYVTLLVLDDVSMVGPEGLQTPWCAMERNADRVLFRCLNTVAVPACTRVEGPYNATHRIVPESENCRPDYAPLHFNRFPDVVHRREDTFWFPPTGNSSYSTSSYGSNLLRDEDPLTVKAYHARSHFKRSMMVENVRLADWAEPTGWQRGGAP
jgi:hypothetical protein